jgi:serine/threonine-protein kinase HipA
LALSVAKYFEYNDSQAKDIISEIKNTVEKNWRKLAEKYKLSRSAIESMSPAFAEF